MASGLTDKPIRWLVDDCAKFVAREKRRGNTYDGIIMDPPSYGRGPSGEVWKLEDSIYDLISQCEEVLSDTPLFFAVNSYTTGLSPAVMEYMLKTTLVPRFGGKTSCDEIGLPVSPPAAWCPAAPPPSGKNKKELPQSRLSPGQLPRGGSLWQKENLSFRQIFPLWGRANL